MSKRIFFAVLFLVSSAVVTSTVFAQSSRAASSVSYRQRGDQWMGQGNSERAIEDYNLALVFDPNNADAYNNRGAARYDRGDFAGAVADYSRALQINPQSADALYNRGLARKAAGDLDGAIADFDQALALKPKLR
ncbi:MAG: tetratricopeptide repeat protein [Blastocatellia bacterium]